MILTDPSGLNTWGSYSKVGETSAQICRVELTTPLPIIWYGPSTHALLSPKLLCNGKALPISSGACHSTALLLILPPDLYGMMLCLLPLPQQA